MNIFNNISNSIITKSDNILTAIINNHISSYGKIEHLTIDRNLKIIEADVIINDIPFIIKVICKNYNLNNIKGKTSITIKQFTTNIISIQNILNEFIANKHIYINNNQAKLLSIYLNCAII